MNRYDLMWITAFWEGEGSCGAYQKVCHSKSGTYRYPHKALRATIVQKDRRILEWVKKTVGYGCVWRVRHDHHFGGYLWSWTASTQQAECFLKTILPHVKIHRRRRQILRALRLWQEAKG